MTDHPTAGRFEGRDHLLPVRVYYEDTDFTGVVYHANYVRYFERGRSDFLRLAGIGHAELLEIDPPLAFVVAEMDLKFVKPARIDDALVVRTTYDTVKGRAAEDLPDDRAGRGGAVPGGRDGGLHPSGRSAAQTDPGPGRGGPAVAGACGRRWLDSPRKRGPPAADRAVGARGPSRRPFRLRTATSRGSIDRRLPGTCL